MNNDLKLYNKANSFIEIRSKGHDDSEILNRVRQVVARLESADVLDDHSNIIKRACNDLLADERHDDSSHFWLRDHIREEIKQISDDDLPHYLFYRYRYDVYPQTHQLDDFPPCLQIEPSSICNYRCVFCYQTDSALTLPKNGNMGMMPFSMFKEIIDQAQGRCDAITLASRGEPLMCRDIEAMLEYVRGKFLAFKMNTNAWFLDERKAHAILQADINTLVFSADAAEEPLYSQLRVNGKLDRVLANIRQFQEIRAKHYPASKMITRVSGVRYSSQQNLDSMEKFWGELVDQVAFVDYNPWENSYEQPINNISSPCSDLWRRTFVWFDGRINPCDVDYLSTLCVGNIKKKSLSEIWTGEKYNGLREAHLSKRRNEMSPCNRCTVV